MKAAVSFSLLLTALALSVVTAASTTTGKPEEVGCHRKRLSASTEMIQRHIAAGD